MSASDLYPGLGGTKAQWAAYYEAREQEAKESQSMASQWTDEQLNAYEAVWGPRAWS